MGENERPDIGEVEGVTNCDGELDERTAHVVGELLVELDVLLEIVDPRGPEPVDQGRDCDRRSELTVLGSPNAQVTVGAGRITLVHYHDVDQPADPGTTAPKHSVDPGRGKVDLAAVTAAARASKNGLSRGQPRQRVRA